MIFIILELAFRVLTHRLVMRESRNKRIWIYYWCSSPYKLCCLFYWRLSIIHWMSFGAWMFINPNRGIKIHAFKPSLNDCFFRLFLFFFIRKFFLQFMTLANLLFVHNSQFLHFVLQLRIFFFYLLSLNYHFCLHSILICRPQLSFL